MCAENALLIVYSAQWRKKLLVPGAPAVNRFAGLIYPHFEPWKGQWPEGGGEVVKKTGNLFKNEGIYYGYARSSPLAEKAYSHIIERNGPVCCSPLSPDFLMEPA